MLALGGRADDRSQRILERRDAVRAAMAALVALHLLHGPDEAVGARLAPERAAGAIAVGIGGFEQFGRRCGDGRAEPGLRGVNSREDLFPGALLRGGDGRNVDGVEIYPAGSSLATLEVADAVSGVKIGRAHV